MCKNISEFYKLEHSTLRDELNNLKKCQVMFLSLSVTGTGVILGILNSNVNHMENAFFSLIPLIILIPFWFIFFDKAHTITRIVGYYRILEKLMLGKVTTDDFVGWENSLAKFRQYNDEENSEETSTKDVHELTIEKSNPKSKSYWLSVYIIFMGLSLICLLLGAYYCSNLFINLNSNNIVLGIAALIYLSSVFYNGFVFRQLTNGKYSYTFNEKLWEKVLKVESKTHN